MSRGEKTKLLWQDPEYRKKVMVRKSVLGMHWKIKDTSKMHKSPWNKGLKGSTPNGANHYRWIKDRSLLKVNENKAYDVKYIYWAREVKKRDNRKCKIANQDCKGHLTSHHILPWRDYPELRYEVNNGITLCHHHHPRKWEDEVKLIQTFQGLVMQVK